MRSTPSAISSPRWPASRSSVIARPRSRCASPTPASSSLGWRSLEPELDEYLYRVDAGRLALSLPRRDGSRMGPWWLLHAIEHSREHIGQATLTLQLHEQARRTPD